MKGKNTMTVGAVNNNNQQNTYALQGMTAGLATGAVAGGTYGYLSKPWLKDGGITDTFVKEADKNIVDTFKKNNKQLINDLKKVQTGSIDGVSKIFKDVYKDEGLQEMTAEQRKAFVKELLQENNVENLDELLKNANIMADEESIKSVTKNAEKFKTLTKDTSLEDLNKLLKDEGLDQIFGTATKENKTQIIEGIQTLSDANIQATKLARKALILEHVDVKKKSMKDLAANADYETKSVYKAIKKAIRNTNLKAAAKWGAIGAGVLGAVGLGVGALNNKKS